MLVQDFLEDSARRLPGKVALIVGDRSVTYAELDQQANRLAQALLDEGGLERGDRVAILLDNSVESVVGLFAALKAGGVFMVVNATTRADKLAFILENSRARVLLTDARRHKMAGHLLDEARHLSAIVLTDHLDGADHPGAPRHVLADWLAAHEPVAPPRVAISVDLAALIYTSGSTGDPKGVMLTHRAMHAAARSICTYLENVEDDVILDVLPISFDYGLYQVLMAFRMGARVVLEKSFAFPHAVLQKVVEHRVTGFPLVPTMSAILLDLDLSAYDLHHVRYLTNTAAALPTEHILQLRQRLPWARLYSMYGLTECKRVSWLPPAELDRRPDSVGIAIPDTEVFVLKEGGRRAAPGEVGELVVRGPHVMSGYWENPSATAARLKPGALPNEMWLYTGDLFKTDEEGFLYFVGRTDDIIKCKGEKVPPREIENVLYKLPGVHEAAVLGVPDPLLGEAVVALVSLKEGADLTEQAVLRHCKAHLEDFMIPSRVLMKPTLPKNPSGKIDKKELKHELLHEEAP